MHRLSPEQKKEIIEYCEQNQDSGWDRIASYFRMKFQIEISPQEIYGFYLSSLMGVS